MMFENFLRDTNNKDHSRRTDNLKKLYMINRYGNYS